MDAATALAIQHAIEQHQALNRLAAGYYVLAIVSLIIVSILIWTLSHVSFNGALQPHQAVRRLSQVLRKALTGLHVGYFLVIPHWIVVGLTFVALNVGLTAWQMIWSNLQYLGSRLGWLALCNMCLLFLLGLKNTPFSPLAGKSYRDLNILHRICGYITVLEVILHAAFFSSGLISSHAIAELQTPIVYAGAVSGISMLILAITGTYIFRQRFYGTFYLLHILFVAITLITMGLHKPDIREKALIIVVVSAAIWLLDRTIRFAQWLYYGHHGYCTLHPMPHGATRVVLSRSMQAKPGSHALLYIPSIETLEQHPFSVMSNDPVEFVVAAHGDFTRRLHQRACHMPGQRCRAILEGPYGNVPDLSKFDKTMLIAGGSGATFAIALALEWLKRNEQSSAKTLHVVWVVRSTSQFQWFSAELGRIRAHPRATVVLHVTSDSNADLADDTPSGGTSTPAVSDTDVETKHAFQDLEKLATADTLSPSTTVTDLERDNSRVQLLQTFNRGRPVVDLLCHRALASATPDDKVLITGSGPSQLLSDIQAATGSAMRVGGPDIRLHLEAYEW